MTIKLSSKASGELPRLAPDLTYPTDKSSATIGWIKVSGIDASSGLTTALSLTGKFVITFLQFSNLTNESLVVKLTVDGVIIWNDTIPSSGTLNNLLGAIDATNSPAEFIQCDTTFLLEVQTATDTSIDLDYLARPIL